MLCIRSTSHGPVSVTSRSSIRMAERIELVFGMWASFHPSYSVLKANSVISKNKGTSLWNFVLNSGLRKFCHGISMVEKCYQLSSRKVDAQSVIVINWAVVDQLVDNTSELWRFTTSLSHRSSSAVYSTILSHGSISDSLYLVQDLSYN